MHSFLETLKYRMNEKALRVLEYPKIIEMLTEQAASAPGKEKCRQLTPSSDMAEVTRMQTETGDALKRIYRKGPISFSGVKDLRADIMRLTIGSSFGISELLDIAKLLDAAARAKQYAKAENLREEEAEPDSLAPMFEGIEPLPALSREIRRCILSEDEIADDASPTLRHIRRQISLSAERIRSQLNSIVNGSMRAYLQDAIITQRDGRYCIPVKAEHRSQVPA